MLQKTTDCLHVCVDQCTMGYLSVFVALINTYQTKILVLYMLYKPWKLVGNRRLVPISTDLYMNFIFICEVLFFLFIIPN